MSPLLDGIQILGVVFLIALNAFFVAAEFALVTVRWTRIEELVQEGRFGALAVRHAISNVNDAIAATQVGSPSRAWRWAGSASRRSRTGSSRCSTRCPRCGAWRSRTPRRS